MGNYDFGHNAQNPFSTGNGYANALIGVFNTYTELTNRVDRDRRHWQTEGYLQDSWRVNPRLTLDYGVRLTHSGGYYDTRKSTAGFLEPSWDPKQAPRLYTAGLHDGRAGQPDLRGEQPAGRAIRRNPTCAAAERVHRQPGAGHRVADQRHGGRRLSRDAAGRVLRLPAARGRAAAGLRLGHQRRRQAGAAGLDAGSSTPSPRAAPGKAFVGAAAGGLHPRGPVGDVRRHRRTSRTRTSSSSRRRSTSRTPAARRGRSRSPTTST